MLTLTTLDAYQLNRCPLIEPKIAAGFPSPAEECMAVIDLNENLIPHPATTFFLRVTGESMNQAGINDGDLLVVDRSLEAKPGKIVVAMLDGEFTVKRLGMTDTGYYLAPENPFFPILEIDLFQDFQIWGVVTHVIHPL